MPREIHSHPASIAPRPTNHRWTEGPLRRNQTPRYDRTSVPLPSGTRRSPSRRARPSCRPESGSALRGPCRCQAMHRYESPPSPRNSLENEPSRIVLREYRVAVPHEAVVHHTQTRKFIEQLARKIAFEQPSGVTAIHDLNGSWVVVFDDQNVAVGRAKQGFVHLRQEIRINVNEDSLDQDDVPRSLRLKVEHRPMMDPGSTPSPQLRNGRGIDLNRIEFHIGSQCPNGAQVHADIGPEFDQRLRVRASAQHFCQQRNIAPNQRIARVASDVVIAESARPELFLIRLESIAHRWPHLVNWSVPPWR